MSPSTDFTRLLQQAKDGDKDAQARAFELVYDELKQVARRVGSDRAGCTLQSTAVVHEAWFKLAPKLDAVKDRLHFFAVASLAMRQVLADHARAAKREKRGGGQRVITLHGDFAERGSVDADLCALDDSLGELARLNPRHARVVELRVFGGLTIAETAEALGVSHGTVESDWSMARAWLWKRLAPAG